MNLVQIQLMWEISIFLNKLMRSASCTSSVKLIMRSTTNSINLPRDQQITMRLPTNSTNFTNELTVRSATNSMNLPRDQRAQSSAGSSRPVTVFPSLQSASSWGSC